MLLARARLLRIEDTRRDEPRYLDSLLLSSPSPTRAAAALTAGRMGGIAHVAPLRTLAADEDPRVAANALFALAMLRDTASVSLATRSLHREPLVAAQGAWLLGEMGERARVALVAALADSSVSAGTRAALLLAATRLKPVPHAAIIPWVASPDSALAWRAAYALARGRSPAGVRPLLAAAASPFGAVREQAARGLGRGMAGDSLAQASMEALRRLARDAEPHVRVNAVRALSTYGALAADAVQGALADADAAVRLTAAQSLDAVPDSSRARWSAAMAADTAFVFQRAVAEGALRRGLMGVGATAWRGSGEWQRRAAAAELDAIGTAPAALDREIPWTGDADGRVRAAAVGAIARLADSAATRVAARAALRAQLRDEDVQVRAAALSGLAAGASVGDLAPALDAYARSRADADADARLAFWQLADSVLHNGRPLPDSLERRVAALVAPGDAIERGAAAHIPRFSAWRDGTTPARSMDWYLARAAEALAPRQPRARIETERGTIELALFGSDAPLTVYNFVTLARAGYFDGQRFHRVVPNFVVQAGDPRGDGNGGPGYAIRDEINPHRYLRGTLGMALSGPNTGGSQFFVTHSPQPHLDGGYTVFGQLLSGSAALDRIVQGDRIVRITIQ